MHIDIHAKNVELNAPLRTFIEEKIADVERLLGENAAGTHAVVEVGIPSNHHHSGPIFYAEANLTISGGHLIRAEATNHDLHSAIVDVKEDLKVQVKKFKEKLSDAQRGAAE
ncbi:MAG: ribosome-associated translation inhibitor RaiA [Candidatus Yanofskybacteria bacterium]|nr:ribosome-associated translation inhibitor RaiA [Candidatus Yanofskybacteria bacterium]